MSKEEGMHVIRSKATYMTHVCVLTYATASVVVTGLRVLPEQFVWDAAKVEGFDEAKDLMFQWIDECWED